MNDYRHTKEKRDTNFSCMEAITTCNPQLMIQNLAYPFSIERQMGNVDSFKGNSILFLGVASGLGETQWPGTKSLGSAEQTMVCKWFSVEC